MFENPTKAIEHLPSLARSGGSLRVPHIPSKADIMDELERADKFGATIVPAFASTYPKLLCTLPDTPPTLTVKGNIELLSNTQSIAIVGARNSSANGYSIAKRLAEDLGSSGYVVVSGLAKGIDTAAHIGALATGTIGVIASGIDHIYPPENKNLYHALYERGAVISELPFGTKPKGTHFPYRNRIISGLSRGVIVVEAAVKSGTLITARFAMEQSREVFAIPGSPLDERSKGTNYLIKDGAYLVETAEEVLALLSGTKLTSDLLEGTNTSFTTPNVKKETEVEEDLPDLRQVVINQLSYSPTALDAIIDQTGMNSSTLSRIIVELELAGRVERLHHNKVVLLHKD